GTVSALDVKQLDLGVVAEREAHLLFERLAAALAIREQHDHDLTARDASHAFGSPEHGLEMIGTFDDCYDRPARAPRLGADEHNTCIATDIREQFTEPRALSRRQHISERDDIPRP